MQGALGLSDDCRDGFEQIRVGLRNKGDAPSEKLHDVMERAQTRSALFDMGTNGVPVKVDVTRYQCLSRKIWQLRTDLLCRPNALMRSFCLPLSLGRRTPELRA